jgi:hypothetical protein
LPWSMWAMMQKFRINSGGVALGAGAVEGGDTTAVGFLDTGGTIDVPMGNASSAKPTTDAATTQQTHRRAPRRPTCPC